jgi:hypothetical protein
MPKPKDTRNQARAYDFVTQARKHYLALDGKLAIPSDDMGPWVSLGRNLESAELDLKPPTEGE